MTDLQKIVELDDAAYQTREEKQELAALCVKHGPRMAQQLLDIGKLVNDPKWIPNEFDLRAILERGKQ